MNKYSMINRNYTHEVEKRLSAIKKIEDKLFELLEIREKTNLTPDELFNINKRISNYKHVYSTFCL